MTETFEDIYRRNTAKEDSIFASSETGDLCLSLLPEELWWHGVVQEGVHLPFGDGWYTVDLSNGIKGNQANPLLLSSKGRFIWSEHPFALTCDGTAIRIEAQSGEIVYFEGGKDLAGAYREAARRLFPATGEMPDEANFATPQYNTWIEMGYAPSQAHVLEYAGQIRAHGFPPGVLMIDDNWFEGHGDWRFHSGRFPDPAAMIEQLHTQGFHLMLWVSPFVSPDRPIYRELAKQAFLVRDQDGEPVVRRWWNGQSALLDLTHPEAVGWLHKQLDSLQSAYGVDGFKFDGGDPEYLQIGDVTYAPTDGASYCEAWAGIGLRYRFNEYRACWKQAGKPLIQRLRDKHHVWGRDGLADLIPNGVAQSLAGFAFTCPDMIGGGEISSFSQNDFQLDQELFVRTTQCSALFPILQFSVAPWRVLDETHLAYCQKAIALRQRLALEIITLARHAAWTGEPILRPMSYVYPEGGFERISDQYLLGTDILVAPVIEQGAVRRRVVFPPGRWRSEEGEHVIGPQEQEIAAPLDRLPWFRRCD